MCGIAGFVRWPAIHGEAGMRLAEAMARVLSHRGPDDSGVWQSADLDVTFAHTRLSIVDLSPTGHQPMRSTNGQWVICFNGEIYNHADLRARLTAEGVRLRGRSDTEALLECIARYGLEPTLSMAEGMYAFALWNEPERRLYLVRDRIGVKPLYWMERDGAIAFASEIKALRLLPNADFALDANGLSLFFRFGYVASPRTIFAHVRKVEPGCILTFKPGAAPELHRYWSAWPHIERRQDISDAEALETLDHLITRSVGQEMIADVPVGCFLSGGVDSALVASVMQRLRDAPIQTFSLGVDDPELDETPHAKAVAAHIGSQHHEIRLDPKSARDIIADLPSMYDEPLSDMAQIPAFLVSKFARARVKVSLSGDGGDELFGGYERYHVAERVRQQFHWLPQTPRRLVAKALRAAPPGMVAAVTRAIAAPSPLRQVRRVQRLSLALEDVSPLNAFEASSATWIELRDVLARPDLVLPEAWRRARSVDASPLLTYQIIDLQTYLPDAVLAKVDRASMATSLEVRVPLLNSRVVEFALGLPDEARLRDGQTKHLIRELLYRYVPRVLVDRPKQGFSIPMNTWLRGPLRDWADDLLSEASLSQSGILNAPALAARWREHRRGEADWSYPLWSVLVFEDWRRRWSASLH